MLLEEARLVPPRRGFVGDHRGDLYQCDLMAVEGEVEVGAAARDRQSAVADRRLSGRAQRVELALARRARLAQLAPGPPRVAGFLADRRAQDERGDRAGQRQ